MKKILFVMNPFAGQRRGVKYLSDILAVFNRAGYHVITYMTAGPGDGEAYVQRMAHHVDIIVCCGGDGTFNEAISGMLKAGVNIPIGYIPAGSTNDFANSLRLSQNQVQAAQDIVEGVPVAYDVGKFGDRYFSYVASFGAFTRSSYTTPQSVKNALGHTAYLLESISELSQIRPFHVRMEMDEGVIEDDFLFGAISNSTSVGGILTLDPKQVDLSDGRLEVLLVRAPKTLTELAECLQALQTQKYNCGMITFCSTRNITVYPPEDMLWTLDGEREEGHACVEVSNQHLAISLIQRKENA